jgi:hypothetical protein
MVRTAALITLGLGVLTLGFSLYVVSTTWNIARRLGHEPSSRTDALRVKRVRVNAWLAQVLQVMVVLLVFGVLDSLGQSLYLHWMTRGLSLKALAAATGLASLLPLGQKLMALAKLLPASARKLLLEASPGRWRDRFRCSRSTNPLGHALPNWTPSGAPDT